MATTLDITHKKIYLAMWNYLVDALGIDGQQIVQSTQNNQPLPVGAIVMQVLFSNNMDESVTTYDHLNKALVTNSVQVRFQLDFYGVNAEVWSRIIYTLWKNHYTTDRMTIMQPLYVQSYNRHPYINDAKNYEDRFILDLALQYNPTVTHAQDFADSANITIIPEP